MAYERQPAFNIDCKEIRSGDFKKGEGFEPHIIITSFGLKVSRVMIAGIVVSIDEKRIDIDDGTDIIRIQSYEDFPAFDTVKVKDAVLILGKIRQFSNEIYVAPEICIRIKPSEIAYYNENKKCVKDLFLKGKIIQKTTEAVFAEATDTIRSIVEESVSNENSNSNTVEKVLNFIDEKDKGDGVEKVLILDSFPYEEIGDIIDTLILEGDIFEIKPQVFKVLK